MNKFYFCAITLCLVFHYSFARQYEKMSEGIRATINNMLTETKIIPYTGEQITIKL